MARRGRKRRIDDRTSTMSNEALHCRSFGHAWSRVLLKPSETADYRKNGQDLIVLSCRNGCTYERRIVLDSDGETISDHGKYNDPKSYLLQASGGGRLSKSAARNAFLAAIGE